MPLYKRKPFPLLEPPQDLDSGEYVYQIRFTKEIIRDYREYLNRLNLYRERVWTCKVTGKSNLTYEEALVSEHRATEKVQDFPKALLVPVLRMIQYSTLTLKDLVDAIYTKLQKHLFEGLELYGKKEQTVQFCKILNAIEDGDSMQYKVGWFDKDKKINDTSIVNAKDLICKKPPLSRSVLKAFVRESTSQSYPWVVKEKFALKHGISTEPPEELRDKLIENGTKKRKRGENGDVAGMDAIKKKTKKEEATTRVEPIIYPIDDLLVRPAADDPIFTSRPSWCTNFRVPMECVGELLMVWDFCSSFSRLLRLSPFSLEDFENAICHKDSELVLIGEAHSAILQLLINDEGDYFMAIQSKKRKSKIRLTNWKEYVCDFLEIQDIPDLSSYVATIKRGHYGILDSHVKLGILCQLVGEALTTNAVRARLDECIEQQQALAAMKREEHKKKREEQGPKKEELDAKEVPRGHNTENGIGNGMHMPHKDVPNGTKEKGHLSMRKHMSKTGDRKTGIVNIKGVKNVAAIKESLKEQQKGRDTNKETQGKQPEHEQREHLDREIEKLSIRTSSLGKDRNYNRYWFFKHEGRLFIESSDSKQWGYYTAKEELDALMRSLNPKGERERALQRQLEKYYSRMSTALLKRSKEMSQKVLLEEAVLRRSTRVRAQPRDSSAMAFLKYVNKWKEK